MIRAFATALLCAVAVVAGDALFRTSLFERVRPIIVSPADRVVAEPPVQVSWQGPRRMRVLLTAVGAAPEDLGVHESPFSIGSERFPRDGGYQVDLRAVRLGDWINATRRFQVHAAAPPAAAPDDGGRDTGEARDLLHALEAARTARDRAHERTKFLGEENAALREESERLANQLETLYKTQEDDAEHLAELERRMTQLSDENRSLAEENAAMRLRLSSVVPCTVWGYYNYPRPQTIPVSRRALTVSDARGQILRLQSDCELMRRADPTAASVCFCVGNSWGG